MLKIHTGLFLVLTFVVTLLNCKSDTKQSSENPYSALQETDLKKSITRGSEIYADFCVSCHLPSGEGVKNAYPPVANSDYLKENRTESIKGLKFGLKGEIVVNGNTYNSYMPPMGLADDEIADVMNYINHSWGNNYGKIVTEEEVAKIKK
jgi:mono/diheme cytochrome c family protein